MYLKFNMFTCRAPLLAYIIQVSLGDPLFALPQCANADLLPMYKRVYIYICILYIYIYICIHGIWIATCIITTVYIYTHAWHAGRYIWIHMVCRRIHSYCVCLCQDRSMTFNSRTTYTHAENTKVQLFPQNGKAIRYGKGTAGLLHITGSNIGRPAWNHLLEKRAVRGMYWNWARMSPHRWAKSAYLKVIGSIEI